MEKIKSSEYPGSIDNFHALMDRIIMLHQRGWSIGSKEYFIHIWRDEKGALRIWDVSERIPKTEDENTPKPLPRVAVIMATERFKDKTLIEFIDGTESTKIRRGFTTNRPIGDDFIKIANEILSEWEEGITSEIPSEPKTRKLEDWFDYLHAVKHRIRIKLEYIADKTGYTYNTVRKEHSLYIKEKGIQKVTKSNKK